MRKVGLLAVKVMRRYYFHIRNGPLYSPDKKGCELQCLEQARELATSVLVELARNTLPGALAHEMVIEVNEDDGCCLGTLAWDKLIPLPDKALLFIQCGTQLSPIAAIARRRIANCRPRLAPYRKHKSSAPRSM